MPHLVSCPRLDRVMPPLEEIARIWTVLRLVDRHYIVAFVGDIPLLATQRVDWNFLEAAIAFWNTSHVVFDIHGTKLTPTIEEYRILIGRPAVIHGIVEPNFHATRPTLVSPLLKVSTTCLNVELAYSGGDEKNGYPRRTRVFLLSARLISSNLGRDTRIHFGLLLGRSTGLSAPSRFTHNLGGPKRSVGTCYRLRARIIETPRAVGKDGQLVQVQKALKPKSTSQLAEQPLAPAPHLVLLTPKEVSKMIEECFAEMERKRIGLPAFNSNVTLPLSREISGTRLLPRLSFPQIAAYDGKSDPHDHVRRHVTSLLGTTMADNAISL
ncbi:hypothetical protein CRG98_023130 [Punica granatum]|uniref:Aminotransferase-like plant mobile domain-containing protein n=1 Tax=Punica granatum TaxID=22663 RepID=A0A2I0JJR3_PUNGR|nr:hypothetical protein CRG98_023130 [Punica granatum]